jgi:hypothetical protein
MHADADEKIGGVVPPDFLSAGFVQELHSALTRRLAAEIAEPLVEFEARLLLESPLQMSLRVSLSASLGQEFDDKQDEPLVGAPVLEHPQALFGVAQRLFLAAVRKTELGELEIAPRGG